MESATPPASFASMLRRYRQAAGLTQQGLAELARLSVRGISDLERGTRRAPRRDTIELLAGALALAPPDRAAFEAAARTRMGTTPGTPACRDADPTGSGAQPPLRTPPPRSTNLPLALTSFVGREREQATLTALLAETRLLTLTGAGGCGKTRLALQLARSVPARYPDGVWLVELAPLTDPTLVPTAIAAVAGVREQPGRSVRDALTDWLAPKRLLLLLDNCEHLVQACAEIAAALLQACPHVQLLATSREPLAVAGERVWRVSPLAVPPAHVQISLEEAARCEAIQLFVARAHERGAAFRLTAQNIDLAMHVCRRLDGIPLALELAAVRLSALSLESLAARLDDRFRLLRGGSRGAAPQQQTLKATLDWSYDLLGEPERILLRRLSVFAGGCSLEAAESVCAAPPLSPEAVLDLLTLLVNRSLVQFDDADDAGRYSLLETVRQYGHELLVAAGDAETSRARHLDWYGALAAQAAAAWHGPHEGTWLRRLESDYDNLRAALTWSSLGPHRQEAGMRLGSAMGQYWLLRGHPSEGQHWLEEVLGHGAHAPAALRAEPLLCLGLLHMWRGEDGRALPLFAEGGALYRGSGDRRGAAMALTMHANALVDTDPAQATAMLERALLEHRELGHQWGTAWSLATLGILGHTQGEYARAEALYEESLALFREIGDTHGAGNQLANLGNAALALGDAGRARAHFARSLGLARALDDRRGVAECLEGIAMATGAAGRADAAARLLGAAERARQASGFSLNFTTAGPHDDMLATLGTALGAEAFGAAWAAGRGLALEDAIALALADPASPARG